MTTSRLILGACEALTKCTVTDLQCIGAFVELTNIPILFECGSASNVLWQSYMTALNIVIPSRSYPAPAEFCSTENAEEMLTSGSDVAGTAYEFYDFTTQILMRRGNFTQKSRAVHVTLVWLYSLNVLRHELQGYSDTSIILSMLDRFRWAELCTILNRSCRKRKMRS